jgi:tRNA (guanine37-N1)-methyltransferase
VDILTVFPGLFEPVLRTSIIGRAQEAGVIDARAHDLRAYSTDRHRRTDDSPFGGGAGMVMTPQPVFDALRSLGVRQGMRTKTGRRRKGSPRLLYMSPRGRMLDAELLHELSGEGRIVLLCGHYEGMDQRVLDHFGFDEVSIGDYILTGGEIPAMVLLDALTRLLPGALGNENAHNEESIYSGLLEYPQYTRPAVFEGLAVPDVLTSGHHREIHLHQFRCSLELTAERRLDLFDAFAASGHSLDKDERRILAEVTEGLRKK